MARGSAEPASPRRRRLSMRWRVALAFGLGSLLVAGVLAVVTWNLATGYMLKQRELSATTQAQANAALVDATLRSEAGSLDDLLAGLSTDSPTSILLIRHQGWVAAGRPVDPSVVPEALIDAAERGASQRQRLTVAAVPVLAVAMPLPDGKAEHTVFVQLFPLDEIDRSFHFLGAVLVTGVLVSAVLGVALGRWAGTRALRPLTQLTGAASRVAGGDLTARLPAQDDPDLAPLADTFNRTAEALEERVRRDERFAGDVSHELRSPLTTMANAAAVLHRRRAEMSGPASRALELLVPEIDRLRHMVVDLLEISRAGQPADDDLTDVDLGELVRTAVDDRGGCAVDVADPAPIVRADRRRLERVVANLVDNADIYGGGPVRAAVLRAGDRARIEIDDAGPGVPVEQRAVVFERFARGVFAGRRADGGGSGLGLALVAQHVRCHGGAVSVTDRPGGGARFVIELPAQQH
ncbi:MAG: HAMP domain-containing histidine kinase, partial [Pseudonocardia sp.]|nr:HAMP domain-containing histidine kinase [Pseudonocardia sp.]